MPLRKEYIWTSAPCSLLSFGNCVICNSFMLPGSLLFIFFTVLLFLTFGEGLSDVSDLMLINAHNLILLCKDAKRLV